MDPMHRYVELRRDLLGVDELHFWDLHVPLFSDIDMKFTYEEACDLVLEALAPLGEDYLAIVRRAVGERWIDVYENPGSARALTLRVRSARIRSCCSTSRERSTMCSRSCTKWGIRCTRTRPGGAAFALRGLRSLRCGGGVDVQRGASHASSPSKTSSSSPCGLICSTIISISSKSTLYRQTMFAEFELAVGELAAAGEPITAEVLCERYRALNERYFGPAACVDDDIALEWARIPHFYYDYYVYQYATGFSAATALCRRRILDEGEPAVRAYKEFLSGGCSKPPIELLARRGRRHGEPRADRGGARVVRQHGRRACRARARIEGGAEVVAILAATPAGACSGARCARTPRPCVRPGRSRRRPSCALRFPIALALHPGGLLFRPGHGGMRYTEG